MCSAPKPSHCRTLRICACDTFLSFTLDPRCFTWDASGNLKLPAQSLTSCADHQPSNLQDWAAEMLRLAN